MAPFSTTGTQRERRHSTGDAERPTSRHREESAEHFAKIGRGIAFDNAFWERVQVKDKRGFVAEAMAAGAAGRSSPGAEAADSSPGRSQGQHAAASGRSCPSAEAAHSSPGRSNGQHAAAHSSPGTSHGQHAAANDSPRQTIGRRHSEAFHGGHGQHQAAHDSPQQPTRRHSHSDVTGLCEPEWQQQVEILDQELEMRRRRAETVVDKWAEEPIKAAGSLRFSKSKKTKKPSEGMRQLEQQVADLRRRQSEQGHLLLAQEDKHRQQEERTLLLLQQQAEEIRWQDEEENRLLDEKLHQQEPAKNHDPITIQSRPEVMADLCQDGDEFTDEEEQLGQAEKEEEDEKMRWQDVGNDMYIGGNDFPHLQEADMRDWLPQDLRRRQPKEKENVGPAAMEGDIRHGWQAKEDPDQQQDIGSIRHVLYSRDGEKRHHLGGNETEDLNQQQDIGAGGPSRWDEAKIKNILYSRDGQQRHHYGGDETGGAAPEGFPQTPQAKHPEDLWEQQQFPDAEGRRRLGQEFRNQKATYYEEQDKLQQEAERTSWQQAFARERHRHRNSAPDIQQQTHEQELERKAMEDLHNQRLLEEAENERERTKYLQELVVKQERERQERRRQAALVREQQEFEREERRRQEEFERQRQELAREERQRQELEREERRRQACENELWERQEVERRRQEMEQDMRRQQQFELLEREERRRQQKLKSEGFSRETDELRRKQRAYEEEIGKESPKAHKRTSHDHCREGLEQESDCAPGQRTREDHEAPSITAQDPQVVHAPSSSHSHTDEPQQRASDAPHDGSKPESLPSPRSLSLYDVLKVERDVTTEDIRKAYKRQCMKHHPDKGGDRDRFEQVGQAYQILSDKALRRAYDHRGMAGVEHLRDKEKRKSQSSGTSQPEKVVEKAQAIVVEAYVPLEVAYTGGSVDVQVVRIASCAHCGGSGTNPSACHLQPMQCPNCDGQGGAMQYVQYGHMLCEQRTQCNVCAGRGLVLPATALCTACGGEQLVEEEVRVPFEIPPGVTERDRLVAKGQGHAMPGLSAGDVTLVCRMQEHQRFLRKGDDLLTEHRVPLQVAICGGAFDVPHLSGHAVRVRLPRGCVLQPGSVKCVPGEGMPKRKNPHLRGDLIVRFGVDFPESLSEVTAARLATAFIGGDNEAADGVEMPSEERGEVPPTPDRQEGEVYLSDFDMEQFGKSLHEAREAYEDDEDDQERAKAAAMAAEAAQRQHGAFYGYGGYQQDFGGFVPPAGSGCQQM